MTMQTNPPYAQSAGGTNGGSSDPQAKAQEATDQARDKAQAVAGQMQDRLREQVGERSSQVASRINEQATDLRSVGESLREQGKDGPAKAVDRMAEYAEKVGHYLGEKDPDAMLHDAEDFGRRQPAALTAGGILLGFAASRFLKASRSRRRSAQRAGQLAGPIHTPPRQSPASDGAMAGGGPAHGVATPPAHDASSPLPPDYRPPVPGSVPPVDRGI